LDKPQLRLRKPHLGPVQKTDQQQRSDDLRRVAIGAMSNLSPQGDVNRKAKLASRLRRGQLNFGA
jgi:hypothetical protein